MPRERLLRRLADASDTPVAALIAPAGYGKTTLLTEWAARDERPFAWVTVDEADNDPARLLRQVASAISELEPAGPEGGQPQVVLPSRFSQTGLAQLARYLEKRTTASVLVLDDVDSLHSTEALAVLTAIAEHLPSGSQLALGARSEPPLPLGRMRTLRSLIELRTSDLAMTPAEATELLAASGIRIDADRMTTLVEHTEGWPAGLYLAALSLRDETNPNRAVPRFAGDDRIVADYLRDELLSRLSPQRLRFLVRTSVLDRLSGPLCDAVLERSGSGGLLQDMSRSNLLLIPLDRHDEWYRYHTLLLEGLRAELHRREPENEAGLHIRASGWYAEHDDPDRAIEHAVAARDARLAGELMWRNVPRYLPLGQVMTVRRWLSRMDDEDIAAHPPLALTAAICAVNLGDGDLAERWSSVAAQALERMQPSDRPPTLEAGLALMRAAVARDGVDRMREDAARAYALLEDDSPWRSMSCLLEGVARHLAGDCDAARERLEEGSRRAAVANVPTVQALCLAQLAVLGGGEVEGVSDGSEGIQAAHRAERAGVSELPDMALVYATSADVRTQRGQIDAAARELQHAQLLLAMLGDGFAPWYQVETRVVLARGFLRISDAPRARMLLAEADRFLHRTPDAVVLGELIDEVRGQTDAYLESSALGASLTTAELRVLQLLPTHLSFAEIAERLHVSTNTVKTQAHAAYRKLDASSRSEAVDRARALGLLGPDTAG